ncbi:unnamed protein product [Cuscuta campestris]|uniref:Uncharacterized protein n=1 Tax=Cuscuta campestris TaxID=132261 RepID=A0A484LSM8_9ASTE|nr:unnamed protein product [Cuscuta campestris]
MGRSSHRWVSGPSAKPVSRTMQNSDGEFHPSLLEPWCKITTRQNDLAQRWEVYPIDGRTSCAYYSGPVQEPLGTNGFSSCWACRMSQAAGNDGQEVPEEEPDYVSVHTEVLSFTPQQASEQAVPDVGPIPEAIPIVQPQFAANFMNFL